MRFIKFLTEGIVRRTAQHDKREEGAIDVIGAALSKTFSKPGYEKWMEAERSGGKRLNNFADALITLASFLDGMIHFKDTQSLDWFFQESFDELRIRPQDRPPHSPHMQNALIYLARRYNQIESEDEGDSPVWYRDMIDKIEAKMNEGSRES